jgi:hypothetical protein
LYAGATSKQVEKALLAAVKKVEWEIRDFPEQLRNDIKSGKFMHVLFDYEKRQSQFFNILHENAVKFRDHGNYDAGLFFRDKVEIYNRIIADQKH